MEKERWFVCFEVEKNLERRWRTAHRNQTICVTIFIPVHSPPSPAFPLLTNSYYMFPRFQASAAEVALCASFMRRMLTTPPSDVSKRSVFFSFFFFLGCCHGSSRRDVSGILKRVGGIDTEKGISGVVLGLNTSL